MTERDLSGEWARTQLEAWADGSLTGESRARMDAAIAADPLLAAAADRAVAVHRALRASPSPSPRLPPGLRRRLLEIPGRSRPARRTFLVPAAASAAVAVVAVAVAVWLEPDVPEPVDPRALAAQEFEVAMRYVQKSARITQGQVTSAVGTGLRDALAASREALAEDTDETGG